MRKRVTVFGARLDQIGEVDADTPLSVLLLDDDRVSQPLRVSHLGD